MAGTLLEVGRGKMQPADVRSILEARDRSAAGPTAPAHGLTLVRITYAGEESPMESMRLNGKLNPAWLVHLTNREESGHTKSA
mgnify:CR=1 FL=1